MSWIDNLLNKYYWGKGLMSAAWSYWIYGWISFAKLWEMRLARNIF